MLSPRPPLYLQRADHPQARACAACRVRDHALFGALDADGLARIHADIATPELAAGQPVYQAGESGGAAYTVRAGIVRFERVTQGGSRRIVRLAGPGSLIGQEALLRRPYAEEAIACTAVSLCRIPRSLIDDMGRDDPSLLHELLQRLQGALEDAESWVADLTTGPAQRRLLKLLQQLDRLADADGRIWLPRRADIGAMLDMTLETASRLVSRLVREGVLQLRPPHEALLDRAALGRAVAAQEA